MRMKKAEVQEKGAGGIAVLAEELGGLAGEPVVVMKTRPMSMTVSRLV
jgi:hypothetical protein